MKENRIIICGLLLSLLLVAGLAWAGPLATLYGRITNLKGGMAGAYYGPLNDRHSLQALALDPQNAKAHLGLDIARANTPLQFGGDLEEGIKGMEKAISLDPNLDIACYYLGRFLIIKKGDKKRARDVLLKGPEVDPENPFI